MPKVTSIAHVMLEWDNVLQWFHLSAPVTGMTHAFFHTLAHRTHLRTSSNPSWIRGKKTPKEVQFLSFQFLKAANTRMPMNLHSPDR